MEAHVTPIYKYLESAYHHIYVCLAGVGHLSGQGTNDQAYVCPEGVFRLNSIWDATIPLFKVQWYTLSLMLLAREV
jgi:hypothetical protein